MHRDWPSRKANVLHWTCRGILPLGDSWLTGFALSTIPPPSKALGSAPRVSFLHKAHLWALHSLSDTIVVQDGSRLIVVDFYRAREHSNIVLRAVNLTQTMTTSSNSSRQAAEKVDPASGVGADAVDATNPASDNPARLPNDVVPEPKAEMSKGAISIVIGVLLVQLMAPSWIIPRPWCCANSSYLQ